MPSYYECYYDHEDDRVLWCGMLAEHQRFNAGYYCKFTRELDGHISLYSHTPHFCEEVPFSRICDYFRKPVYRRSADV